MCTRPETAEAECGCVGIALVFCCWIWDVREYRLQPESLDMVHKRNSAER